MTNPTTEQANARLNELFHAYLLHMPRPIQQTEFDRIRQYLFLSCDSQSKPTPVFAWVLLLLLICAESYAFSFLMGVSLSGDMSQDRADMVAVGIAFILGLVLLILAHNSGHSLRRTKELRQARRHMIDTHSDWPEEEKSRAVLTKKIALEDDQDIDKPLHSNFDSQRIVNRVAKNQSDDGGYILPILFIIAVIMIGIGQFELRALVTADDGTDALGGAPEWANALFVLIFFMTQGLALLFGYKYGFMGLDSQRGFQIIDGRDSYHEYKVERDPMIRRADESLSSLLSKLRSRYSQIKPDDLTFMQRFHQEEDLQERAGAPVLPEDKAYKTPAAAVADPTDDGEGGANVTPIGRDNAG